MIFDQNNPETRKLIDDAKSRRLHDPWKADVLRNKSTPEILFQAWVEQIADAELYYEEFQSRTLTED